MDYLMQLLDKSKKEVANIQQSREFIFEDVKNICQTMLEDELPFNQLQDPITNLRNKTKLANEYLSLNLKDDSPILELKN